MRDGGWKTPAGLTAVAALLAALATLIGLAMEEDDPPVSVVSSQRSEETVPPPTGRVVPVEPQTVEPEPASVDLVYAGDTYGCNLQVTVQIGEQTILPTGNRFTVRNVETGTQRYEIRGSIHCALAGGSCTATGSGVLDVDDGDTYLVAWLNTSFGVCEVTLNE